MFEDRGRSKRAETCEKRNGSRSPHDHIRYARSSDIAQIATLHEIARGLLNIDGRQLSRATDVCFSNRPFRVKRFQTIHDYSVDVAHGLVLLFGIGTKALPSWGSRRGGTIFGSALPLDER